MNKIKNLFWVSLAILALVAWMAYNQHQEKKA